MCMSARDYNYNKKEISIISPIMPYKIIMRISEKELNALMEKILLSPHQ